MKNPFSSLIIVCHLAGRGEDCVHKVHEFCKNVLKIPDPVLNIGIDRAHRIGRFQRNKTRPIVVKFCDSKSKMTVKNSLKNTNLRNTNFNVKDQFPQEVVDKRRNLIPAMIQARRQGKKAVLVRDKLYMNNKLYTSNHSDQTNNTA